MLRILALATTTAIIAAPFSAMACGAAHKNKAQVSIVDQYAPGYIPTAASTVTVDQTQPLQSTPIDANALVFEQDAVIETVQPVFIPEG